RLGIEPGALRFHESIGTPVSVVLLDGDAVRIEAVFEGEGDTWQDARILRLENADMLVVADEDGTQAARRVRCD
ncbi:MAG: hypothetical protein ABW163_11500, partial [Luteimonas sp.]